MIVFLDTEKLREANPIKPEERKNNLSAGGYWGWEECSDKTEEIGTPVADIVKKLRNATPKGFNQSASEGWEICCYELKRILEEKP